jgi:hypothetical protein
VVDSWCEKREWLEHRFMHEGEGDCDRQFHFEKEKHTYIVLKIITHIIKNSLPHTDR